MATLLGKGSDLQWCKFRDIACRIISCLVVEFFFVMPLLLFGSFSPDSLRCKRRVKRETDDYGATFFIIKAEKNKRKQNKVNALQLKSMSDAMASEDKQDYLPQPSRKWPIGDATGR